MSEQETKWYRAKKGGQVGVIPDIGVHDPATPIPVRNPEHEARILASGLYEEAPAPKVKAEPQPCQQHSQQHLSYPRCQSC